MPAAPEHQLKLDGLCVDVPGRRLVDALTVELGPGEFVAILGRNGTGKTMTMLTLSGLRETPAGVVSIDGVAVERMKRRDVALRLALLPQTVDDIFPSSVLETALIGRHPHIGPLRWESDADRDIAIDALTAVDMAELADRDVLTLSGGERRRLAIAQVLTQSPSIYLLDEPTNHLDPQHQIDVLELFRGIADAGGTVIASLHDVNMAARYADRCLLLYGDGRWEFGTRDEVLDEATLAGLYATPMEAVPWGSRKLFVAGERDQSTKPDSFSR